MLKTVRTFSWVRAGMTCFIDSVKTLREQKSDSDVRDRASQTLDRHLDIDAERFHDIRAAAPAARRAISMLRDANAGARGDERRGRRNVEGAGAIAAGSAGIEHRQRLAVPEAVPPFRA